MSFLKSKRAISSIISGLIFFIIMAAGFSVYFLAINTQSGIIDTNQLIQNNVVQKSQEDFELVAFTNSTEGDRLHIIAANTGSDTLDIVDIWIINKTDPKITPLRYDVNFTDSLIAPSDSQDLLENTVVQLGESEYQAKAVSSLGSIRTVDFASGDLDDLFAEIIIMPPNPLSGEIINVLLYVINTGKHDLVDVTPNPMVTTINAFPLTGFPQPAKIDLEKTDGAFFVYKYIINGQPGNTATFTGSANGTDPITNIELKSNDATDSAEIIKPVSGVSDNQTFEDDLLNKPGIFMLIPGPFGESDNDDNNSNLFGLWGMNVVNPTPNVMKVSRVTISAFGPGSVPGDKFFDDSGAQSYCNVITLSPANGTFSCPEQNQLIWKNTSPVSIEPFSVESFLAQVRMGELTGPGSTIYESVIVHGHVQTSIGQFGKAGYDLSVARNDMSIVNLYLTSEANSTNASKTSSVIKGIKSGSTITLNVTLADFDTGSPAIENATVTTNIPRTWEVVNSTLNDNDGPFVSNVTKFADDSSEVKSVLSDGYCIDGWDNGPDDTCPDSLTIQFDLIAPPVLTNKMFVMHILADGDIANSAYSMDISPLLEVILQVVP